MIQSTERTTGRPPRRIRATGFACALLLATSYPFDASLQAQGMVSGGVGVGAAVGGRHRDTGGNGTHGAAYVQFRLPIFPVALRADVLVTKTSDDVKATSSNALSLMADAVYIVSIPVVQPYVLAGYGKYGIGKDASLSGWNAGVGARVRTPWVAVYAEARRHQRVGRDLLTIGISR